MDKKYTIMIAEDEILLLNSLSKNIYACTEDFEIIASATNGKSMMEEVAKNPPDVLFTDIEMPGMNGIDLIAEVKNTFENVLCVIISSYDKFEYAQTAIKLKVNDYLLKPVGKAELAQLLKKLKAEIDNIKIHNTIETTFAEFENCLENSIEAAVKEMYECIKQNYKTDIDVSVLSKQYYFNELHLSRTFKHIVGSSPSKLINELRIQEGEYLLQYKQHLSISQISDYLGFSSPMYFNRVFKLYKGMTPGDYRKRT